MKLKNILKVALCLLIASLVTLLVFKNENKVETNAAEPTLSVSAKNVSGTTFIPDTSGLINITLTLSAATSKDVVVIFFGRDATAISAAGDYYFTGSTANESSTNDEKAAVTHQMNKITISAGQKSASVTFKTYTTKDVVKVNNAVYARYFYFVIDQVDNATISTKEYKCSTPYTHCFNTFSTNGGYRFNEYYGSHSVRIDTGDQGFPTYSGNLLSDNSYAKRSEMISNVLNTGMASLYTYMHCELEANWPNINETEFWLYGGSSANNNNLVLSGMVDGMWWSGSVTLSVKTGVAYHDSYGKMPASTSDKYYIVEHNHSGIDRDTDIDICTYVIDETKATLKKAYLDASSVKTDGKIFLCLRFSEPVQIIGDTSKVSLIAYANSKKSVKFTYSAGAYSDTLVFEANINGEDLDDSTLNITSFNLDSLENCQMIYDFGRNWSGNMNKWSSNKSGEILKDTDGNKLVKCSIDLRKPVITTTTKRQSEIVQTREVNVTINKYGSGRLYYTWSKDANKEFESYKDYDSYVDVDKTENGEHKLSIYGMEMTGEYYLYLYVVSDFGKSASVKVGITSKDKDTGKDVVTGGYLFDNEKPTITKDELIIDTLTNKTFLVTADDGVENYCSRIVSLYANVATKKDLSDSVKTCIWTSDGSINKVGLTTTGYELTSNAKRVYLTGNDEVVKENYNNTSELAVFSSKNAAIEYLSMIEYTDFQIVSLSQSKVQEILNNGYMAEGEIRDNVVYGSLWIRYKSKDWDYSKLKNNNSQDSKLWVYYYYGTAEDGCSKDELDPSKISANLQAAVEQVASTIASYGQNINFIEKGYEENGLPKIQSSKLHLKDTVTKTALSANDNIKGGLTFEDSRLSMSEIGGSCTVCLEATNELIAIPENEYGTFYIYFSVIDGAGNLSKIGKSYACKYDRRTLFDSECTVLQNNNVAESVDKNQVCYDLAEGSVVLRFKTILKPAELGTIGINKIYYQEQGKGKELKQEDWSKYFDISNVSNLTGGNTQIEITCKSPGLITIELKLDYNNTIKVSNEYSFYITNGKAEETLNKRGSDGNNVYNNQVFQLSTDFHYMDMNLAIKTAPYGNSYLKSDPTLTIPNYNATFSDKYVATDYVRFMEYQDFYLINLTNQVADYLNNGSTNKDYVKADGETTTAKAGQSWIRYKRKTWTKESTQYDWVYYWYDNNTVSEINVSKISTNLSQAVNDVTAYIIGKGSDVQLVGADHTDKYGAPTIHFTQGHAQSETATSTMVGTKINPNVSYNGDENLYKNTVKDQSDGSLQEIPLVSNIELHTEDYNYVYYAYSSGLVDINDLVFQELIFADGTTYRKAINGATGTYIIREFGKEGMNQYKVYIDNLAPVLKTSYEKALEEEGKEGRKYELTLDSTVNGSTYSAKSFTLGQLDGTKEQDELCYVAIYNKSTMKLRIAYFYDYLLENSVVLENGEYYIVCSDRSGNSFDFTVLVNDQELKVDVKTSDDNNSVNITINRTAEQIYRYEVYLNGGQTKINKDWEGLGKTQRFYQSGYYDIYVEDIYGFKVSLGGETSYSFERDLPELIWSYDTDGKGINWKKYEEGVTKEMEITSSLGSRFYINTSRALRFTMPDADSYTYSFTQGKPTVSVSANKKVITVTSDTDWEMEIWYTKYPDIKATYVCVVDMTAPEILVKYARPSYTLSEQTVLLTQAETAKLGDIYTPSTIKFENNITSDTLVLDGDTIFSNLIKLSCQDASGVQTIQVYLNEELLGSFDADASKEGYTGTALKIPEIISLSRTGKYRIVSTDIFGNTSSFSFENKESEYSSYTLDSREVDLETTGALYGNTSSVIEMKKDGVFAVKVTRLDGTSYIHLYNVKDGIVYEAQYTCSVAQQLDSDGNIVNVPEEDQRREFVLKNFTEKVYNALGIQVEQDKITFSSSDQGNKVNRWYQILTEMDENEKLLDGFNLFVKYDKDGNIFFMVDALTERIKVEMRVSFGLTIQPYYFEANLSHEKTDVKLVNEDEQEITIDKEGVTYTNKSFVIDPELSDLITKIEYSYSDVKEFSEYITLYPIITLNDADVEVTSMDPFDCKENGFYSFRIYNKFGNVNEYLINRSDVFTVLTIAKYEDETENRYNEKYTDVTKSNKQVVVEAYAYSASFSVTKENLPFDEYTFIREDSIYYITLYKKGNYKVTCVDNYGNEVIKEIIIDNTKLEYKDSLITGFNEKALRKSEGYTNYKLSVSKNALDELGIKYLAIINNGNTEILMDDLAQTKTELNVESLANSIGKNGSGDYTVVFRDEYGSVAKKIIHYREETTISLSRRIRTSQDFEALKLEDVLQNGAWSNNIIKIESAAETYEAIMTEVSTNNSYQFDCPKEISFSFSGSSTTIEYSIYYVDEYGFEYTFDATLFRKEITITTVDLVKTTIDEIDTTRDDVAVSFSSGTCTYTLDGVEKGGYTSSTKLYKDGTYRFNVMDIAGNAASLQIKKDTYVDFSIYDKEQERDLINGEAVNKGSLTFKSNNNDKVVIKSLYVDGVAQSDTNQMNFTKHGHYVLILEDKVGNTQMFEFYIILHEFSEFSYETPTGYYIQNITYSDSPGNYVSYMESGRVIQNADNSTFDIFENGEYEVVVTSDIYLDGYTFIFTIDNSAPAPVLVGCNGNEKTVNDVTVEGLQVGDTVYVYKDGTLVSTTYIESDRTDAPVITEGGKYKIIVKNRAGVTTTVSFEKTVILNTPGSVLIIIICFAVAGGIIAGVLLRNKQKFDE